MRKYRLVFLFMVFMCMLPQYGIAAPQQNAIIILDGRQLDLPAGVQVAIQDDSVLVPIRVIVENLGFDVSWNQANSQVTVTKNNLSVELTIGSKTAVINGTEQTLISAPIIRASTSYVPLRFISEAMGLNVSWDQDKKAVILVSPKDVTTEPDSGDNGSSPVNQTDGNLILVNGISFSDNCLTVNLNGSAKPHVFKMTNPDRIVADIPDAKFADSFGSGAPSDLSMSGQLEVTGSADVAKVRYALYSQNPSTVRIVIDLNKPQDYTVTSQGSGQSYSFIVAFKAAGTSSAQPITAEKIVVLDAGHGGSDPGTTGATGTKEKNFTFALVLKIEALLKQQPGIQVILTRKDDTYVKLADRAKTANDIKADAFISIHANAAPGSPSVSGTESFYYHDSSKALADTLHKHLIAVTGFPDRKVKKGNLQVLRDTNMPAALLEIGFLSNPAEESLLFDDDFQQRVAQGIADGIKEFLGMNGLETGGSQYQSLGVL